MPDVPRAAGRLEAHEWRRVMDARLAALGVSAQRRVDIVAEVSHHLLDRYDELRAAGHSDGDARRLALEDLESERLLHELGRIERRTTRRPLRPLWPSSSWSGWWQAWCLRVARPVSIHWRR